MATIFDGYRRATDEEIIDQIALLETLTMVNTLKIYRDKTLRQTARMLNRAGRFAKQNLHVREPRVLESYELIEEKRRKLKYLPRFELEAQLREVLCDRAGLPETETDDMISATVINKSAKHLGINDLLTPARKADLVTQAFNEKVYVQIQKELAKQKAEQAIATERHLDKTIEAMPEEQRVMIQELLQVEELTGKTLRDTVLKASTPGLIMTGLSAAGAASYVAASALNTALTTTIVAQAATTTAGAGLGSTVLAGLSGPLGWVLFFGIGSFQLRQGAKRIDNEMLAQSVWFAVSRYGGAFTAAEEEKEKSRRAMQMKQELEVRQAQIEGERLAAEVQLTEIMEKMGSLSGQHESDRLEMMKVLLVKQAEVETLTSQLAEAKQEIECQHELIVLADEEIEEGKQLTRSLEEQLEPAQREAEEWKEEARKRRLREEREEENRRKRLQKSWSSYFPRFDVEPAVLRDAAKLTHSELLDLERALRELHEAEDPRSISANRGKLHGGNNTDHIRLTLRKDVEYRLEYRVNKRGSADITLVKLYPKNGKYMQ